MYLPEISEQEQERSGICLDNTKRIRGVYEGVLTGKGLSYGGISCKKRGNRIWSVIFDRGNVKTQRNRTCRENCSSVRCGKCGDLCDRKSTGTRGQKL